ncbi:MAG: TIM barrel protein [Anaerolineae bacterium]|nr:TIM barrel protein [Anaerolineae bacterium]
MAKTERDPIRFGTVGSPQTTPTSGTPAAIEHSRILGLDHLEIAWVRSVSATEKTCAEIKAAGEEHGISLSVHAPYFINLNSQTSELMAKSDERLLKAARTGFLAGARDIVFHPGSYHEQPPEQVYERIKEKLVEIRGILDEEGVDVILRPETMGKVAVFGTLDELLQLSKEIPGVMLCIDWAHLHAREGDGSFNSYDEFADALKRVKDSLGDKGLKQLHCHLSGIEYTQKGEKKHLPLNQADIQYRELLQALVDSGAEGVVATEAPEPFHVSDCLTIQATYRHILSGGEAKRNL